MLLTTWFLLLPERKWLRWIEGEVCRQASTISFFISLWSIAAPFYMLFFLPLFIFLDSVFFASLFCFPKFEGAQFGCDGWEHEYVKVSEAYICTLLLWSCLLLCHTCKAHAICKFQSSDYDCVWDILMLNIFCLNFDNCRILIVIAHHYCNTLNSIFLIILDHYPL